MNWPVRTGKKQVFVGKWTKELEKNMVRERTMETKTSARWEVLEENANLRLDCDVSLITITWNTLQPFPSFIARDGPSPASLSSLMSLHFFSSSDSVLPPLLFLLSFWYKKRAWIVFFRSEPLSPEPRRRKS